MLLKRYIALKTEKNLLKTDISNLKNTISIKKEIYEKHIKARWILSEVVLKTQDKFKTKIEPLITSAIKSVFDRNFEFKLEFEEKRNKMECRPVILEDGDEFQPKDDLGGGMIDIISFAFRIVLWSLKNPKTRNSFILDEPFKNGLGDELYIKAGKMLKKISTSTRHLLYLEI